MRIRIAARQSDLARLQAYRVGDALKAFGHDIVYQFRASLGDINLNDPLWKMPEKGVFTEDFVRDLREGTADLVVHSWKDLPTQERADTEIIATLPRADRRDLLLFRRDRIDVLRDSRNESGTGSGNGGSGRGHGGGSPLRVLRVLTSSPRRAHNLREFLREHLPFPVADVSFEPVRGNIQTRLQKLLAQDVDALIVAKAALDRLLQAPEEEFRETQAVVRDVLVKTRFMVLPLTVNPTAAAQGALAIEIPKNRPDLVAALAPIHCLETFETVRHERRILASHGGGCHQKIGVSVLRRAYGEITFVRGLTDAGLVLDEVRLEREHADEHEAAASEASIFPRAGEEVAFFDREPLAREMWQGAEKASFLWVARETAWPDGFCPEPEAIVWAAGLTTWRKLAARGIWVSGSAEGLGETESPDLETMTGVKQIITWVKLTHDNSSDNLSDHSSDNSFDSSSDNSSERESVNPRMVVAATYRLRARESGLPNLRGRTHFFWISGSAFDRALALEPGIRHAHHASGPGLTHRHLRRVLGEGAQITVHLSVQAWRQTVLRKNAERGGR